MITLEPHYADYALYQGLGLLKRFGVKQKSRAGNVLVMPCPVTTVTHFPQRRVLFSAKRNANPVFHLMEALWMLAGRNDATWLDQFVSDFSMRFAEPDGTMHAAYGFRWRKHFDFEDVVDGRLPDQIDTLVVLLKKNPDDRRAVLTMWDPVADLGTSHKDIACNTHIYLRVRKEIVAPLHNSTSFDPITNSVLDLTVCCRSNDIVWGAYGSNLVHFSLLQEYLAARIGVGIGVLYQVSNNYHVYTDILDKFKDIEREPNRYIGVNAVPIIPLASCPEGFDADLKVFFSDQWATSFYNNEFFAKVAVPMRYSYALWRNRQHSMARAHIHNTMTYCDWSCACWDWYTRHINNMPKEE